jgi:hypothetical protein
VHVIPALEEVQGGLQHAYMRLGEVGGTYFSGSRRTTRSRLQVVRQEGDAPRCP